jgi:hypothetical protein
VLARLKAVGGGKRSSVETIGEGEREKKLGGKERDSGVVSL